MQVKAIWNFQPHLLHVLLILKVCESQALARWTSSGWTADGHGDWRDGRHPGENTEDKVCLLCSEFVKIKHNYSERIIVTVTCSILQRPVSGCGCCGLLAEPYAWPPDENLSQVQRRKLRVDFCCFYYKLKIFTVSLIISAVNLFIMCSGP